MMRKNGRVILLVVTGVMLLWGVTHASLSSYQQKEQAIREACIAAREKLSAQEQKQLACNTPEISLKPVSVKPGETAEVAITGKFPAGTSFVIESDCVEVLKESANANSYRATVKVAPGCGPQIAPITAFVPICCKSAESTEPVSITGDFEWDLKAANGWTVKAHSIAAGPGESQTSQLPYLLEFFRGGETAPFTKRRATLSPSRSDPPSYYFSISSQDESAMNVQQEMANISQQMANPNLSEAQRERLTQKMQEIMTKMTSQMGNVNDPAYLQKLQEQEQEFGCTSMNLESQNGAMTGKMTCSERVGRSIDLTGTMKLVTK
jgi:hypothetical protein